MHLLHKTKNKKAMGDGSYSVPDTEDYFEYINKKHENLTDNHPVKIYVKKIENRIRFRIETGYYLQVLTPETIKLLGSTKNNITKDENGENEPHLENTQVVLVHCNITNNDYQQDSNTYNKIHIDSFTYIYSLKKITSFKKLSFRIFIH